MRQRQDRTPLQLGREISLPWAGKLDPPQYPKGSNRPWVGRSRDGRLVTQATNEIYLQTARLLTRIAPLVLVNDTFALKGGTAINLF
jgi:hypothetical protein